MAGGSKQQPVTLRRSLSFQTWESEQYCGDKVALSQHSMTSSNSSGCKVSILNSNTFKYSWPLHTLERQILEIMLKWTPSTYFSLKFEDSYLSARKVNCKYATQIVWSHMMSFFSLILIMSCQSIRKLSFRQLPRINQFQPLAMGFINVSIRLQSLLQESIPPMKNL